ncbi:MAG: 2-hydroxyglutaryl-CoA dehydratase [Halanaerobiales bacterium]|nr:2-hydroxyglutaryl-CoA dehydratase [Halanaerobiales bacterium]
MKILGIDIGSTTTKIVLIEEKTIIDTKIMSSMSFYRDYCSRNRNGIFLDIKSLDLGDVDKIVSTGYGRNNVRLFNAEAINELKAHSYGAIFTTGLRDFTLLDIGGQDSKVIRVEKGIIVDLELNDKCAASSGRFIENMARVLEVKLSWLAEQFQNPVLLNTTCAIFGESELISNIAEGINFKELAAGVNFSLYKRIEPILKKFPQDLLIFTGGVAYNLAIRTFLKELNYQKIIIPKFHQLNGAIGCCYYGQRF